MPFIGDLERLVAALYRELAEAGGGRVGAESRDGLTRFWFSLPR